MKVEVTRYRKVDGFLTRHWAVTVNGELLAVTLYRKGALAFAGTIVGLNASFPAMTHEDAPEPVPAKAP